MKRGFSSLLKDVNCKKIASIKSAKPKISLPVTPEIIDEDPPKKRSFLGCMGLAKMLPPNSQDVTFFFTLLPPLLHWRRKSKKNR